MRQNFRSEPTRSTLLDPKLMFWCISTVWVHLRPFGSLTKLGAKRFELVQKFVPRRCVGVFRNERTRSTPLDPKHMLWCVSHHLHAFGTVRLPYETRGKMFRTNAKVRATKSCFFAFRTIWVHLGPFDCLTKLGAKRAELVQ